MRNKGVPNKDKPEGIDEEGKDRGMTNVLFHLSVEKRYIDKRIYLPLTGIQASLFIERQVDLQI